MDLGSFALKNKPLVVTCLITLVLGGYLSYRSMSKLEDPEIKVKRAVVAVIYPGASAHQVELEAVIPLEKSIRSMASVANVESKCCNDVAMLTVELLTTVQDDDTQQQWDLLRRKVYDTSASLPDGVSTRIMDDYGDVYGMFYAMTSDGFDDQELSRYAQLLSLEVQKIEGISQVQIYGERAKCVNVEIKQERMGNLGVHPIEVLLTLRNQNSKVYAGYFESGDKRMRVEIGDGFATIDDVRNLLIQGHEDDQLRLSDVADIYFSFEEPVRNSLRYDGKHAVGILISAHSGTDITKIGPQVKQTIERVIGEDIPIGIEVHPVFNQPDLVNNALSTFLINLIESVLIVVFVLMLTMGFKSGLIIGISLIIIVFGSFFILNMAHGTLQRVSLGSFILAMGMLVDNAIVIIDGILVDMNSGIKKPDCFTRIGRKTAIPLLGATIIAILAFFPIFMSPDVAGTYVRDLFIVVAVSLLLSWLLALTHVPIHASVSLARKKRASSDVSEQKDPYGNVFYRALRNVLDFTMNNRILTVTIAVGLLFLSVYCYRYLPQMFFPDMDYSQLYIEYRRPEGATSDEVMKDIVDMENMLRQDENVTHITSSLGGSPGRYCLVRAIASPSMSYGELIVDFKDAEKMIKSIPELQRELTERYPQAYVRVKRYNLMYRDYPIEATFIGPDPAVLKDLCEQAESIMRESDATFMETNNWSEKAPVLVLDYDQSAARQTGVSRSDAGRSVMAAMGGIPVAEFRNDDRMIKVMLKSTDAEGNNIESVENAPIWPMSISASGVNMKTVFDIMNGIIREEDIIRQVVGSVPLNQVTSGLKIRWDEQVVCRRNGERAIKAQCNNAYGYTAAQARDDILEKIEAIELPEGYSLVWLGEYDASEQSSKYLFKNVPLSIVMMILIMIALFKDIRKPLVILCCIPMVAIGVVFGMLASGKGFGFVAIVGCLGIIGMMIKNGIVLIDDISFRINSGEKPYKALIDSTVSRFRPVMMASLTTVVGMIPLLSDPLFGSLAVTIMGGLTVGTLIILIFLPALYSLFFGITKSTESAVTEDKMLNE
ncbi:MAG: efflux RND transporter permease subunit [Alistipes sp.]|nr:efflux RND transporter permease subunit [Candidatus Minthomonas equi]